MLTPILIIALGLVILGFGKRLALFGAGVGALVGIWIVSILPGAQDGLLAWAIPLGLAILFAFGAGLTKTILNLITLVLGALAGWAIVMGLLSLFGLDWGFVNVVLGLVGAVIGAALVARLKDWAVIILAAIVGALLCVQGLQMIFPSLTGMIASLIGLVLAGASIAYNGGFLGSKAAPKTT